MFQTKKNKQLLETNKEWFVIYNNVQEGPYSLFDLKNDIRFTPDIFVWKKGFHEWVMARYIPEVQKVFKDEVVNNESKDFGDQIVDPDLGQQDQAALAMQQDPYQFLLWFIILMIVLLYTFYQLSK